MAKTRLHNLAYQFTYPQRQTRCYGSPERDPAAAAHSAFRVENYSISPTTHFVLSAWVKPSQGKALFLHLRKPHRVAVAFAYSSPMPCSMVLEGSLPTPLVHRAANARRWLTPSSAHTYSTPSCGIPLPGARSVVQLRRVVFLQVLASHGRRKNLPVIFAISRRRPTSGTQLRSNAASQGTI